MKKLQEYVKDLKNELAGMHMQDQYNFLLSLFDADTCKQIDERAYVDKAITYNYDLIIAAMKRCTKTFSPAYEEAFNLYNEIVVYDYLRSKSNNISFCTRKDVHPTPDFIFSTPSGTTVNIELKTISFAKGKESFKHFENEVTRINKNIKDDVDPGVFIASAYAPPEKVGGNSSRAKAVESLVMKITRILEKTAKRQLAYQGNPGILLIDMVVTEQTLSLFLQDALPLFQLHDARAGMLWNACFGKKNDIVIQDLGQEALTENGVLVGDNAPDSIIFSIRVGSAYGPLQLIGFSKNDELPLYVSEALNAFCDFTNDRYNRNPNKIPVKW